MVGACVTVSVMSSWRARSCACVTGVINPAVSTPQPHSPERIGVDLPGGKYFGAKEREGEREREREREGEREIEEEQRKKERKKRGNRERK